jgi:hypothetical protein
MIKEFFYSHKTWLLLGVLVCSVVLITFQSVYAADSNSNNNEFEPWTSNGYREVTVKLNSQIIADTAAPQEDCTLNTTGLVAHWPLDEALGASTFVDVVGSMNGTCEGAKCPTKSFGKVGTAFNFVASEQDVISVPAAVDPGKSFFDTFANGNFSAGVWVRTVQICEVSGPEELKNKVFFGRYRDVQANGTWWLGCTEPGGVAVFRLRDSSNIPRQVNGTTRINDGRWHYIVGVRDAGADKNYLYVDGQLEGMLDTPLYTGNFSSDWQVTMGAYDEPRNYYLDGILDDIVLYNRVIPENEIATYYGACKTVDITNYLPMIVR